MKLLRRFNVLVRHHALEALPPKGEVGLVPFALHDEASFPAGLNSTPGYQSGSQVLFADDFSDGSGEVRLKFYGPIRVAEVDSQHPEYTVVNVCLVNRANPSECGAVSAAIIDAAVDSSDSTVLVITSNDPNCPLIPGKYRITPGQRLRCDLGLGASDPAVRSFSPAYEFYLASCGSSANERSENTAWEPTNPSRL